MAEPNEAPRFPLVRAALQKAAIVLLPLAEKILEALIAKWLGQLGLSTGVPSNVGNSSGVSNPMQRDGSPPAPKDAGGTPAPSPKDVPSRVPPTEQPDIRETVERVIGN